MKASSAVGLSRAGIDRRVPKSDQSGSFFAARRARLLGTCLTGAAAAALLMSPDFARAAEACGAPVAGVVECPAGTYPDGIQYQLDAPAPAQDLTVRLDDGLEVVSAADQAAGVGVFNGTGGDVTISGANTTVSTSGSRAAGVNGVSTGGDVVIDVGTVSTSGYRSDGIFASTNYGSAGNVTIKAGYVATSGQTSVGVRAVTSYGDIDIDAGVVFTRGEGSDGIFAEANYGNATVKAGEVVTTGDVGRGVTVYSQGVTTVVVDRVATTGQGFGTEDDAGGIKAVGTKVSVTAGTVTTRGDYSVGIYANTNHVAFDDTIVNPDIEVTAGTVTTSGFASDGIVALNYADGGKTRVDVGKVDVRGDYAWGVYAAGVGDVTVNAGTITTSGLDGRAIDVLSVGGDIAVTAGSISTAGVGGTGVNVVNYSQDGRTDIVVNKLETRRDYADGVRVEAYGDVAISVGDLSTNGFHSNGVSAVSVDGSLDVAVGKVVTGGDQANGVDVVSYYGQITVNAGSVATSGAKSAGIYAMGGGGITVHAGEVTTSGKGGLGIGAINFSTDDVTVVADTVTTSGPGAGGVVAVGYGGLVTVVVDTITTTGETVGPLTGTGAKVIARENDLNARFGEISTAGAYAVGVFTLGSLGDQHVVIDRSVTTTGKHAEAVFATEEFGDAVIDIVGKATTSGSQATGVAGYVTGGDMTVNVAGGITTSGDGSAGVSIKATSFGRGPATYYGETQPYIYDATIHINANSITTSGANSTGIVAVTDHILDYADSEIITNAVDIKTGTVKVTGAGSLGISATGLGRISVDAGNTYSAKAEAIRIQAADQADLNVRGATVSKAADAVVMTGHDLTVTIAAGGGVAGATNGLVLTAVGDDDADASGPVTPTGAITLTNAGAIVGGEGGYVVLARQGAVSLSNSGRIVGAIKLANGDDSIVNSGQFAATADSDFGLGEDVFTNSGVLGVRAGSTTAGSVAFLGLERFENAGGLVDLRNGHAGDVFTLPGDYVAAGDARLGLDVTAGAADKLVIGGMATGRTTIVLGLKPADATLTGPAAPILVQAGAGSTATFVLGNPDIGLIHYELTAAPDGAKAAVAAPVSYSLKASAGAPVYATLALQESARTAWGRSAEAWSSHLAAMRGDAWAGGADTGRFWAQAFGSNADRSATASGGVAVDYHQDDRGVQIGADLVRASTGLGDVVWGVTGGYSTAEIESGGGLRRGDFETLDVGGYAALTRGASFANALVKFDRHRISTSDQLAGYSADLDGSSVGARFELGRRFGNDRFAVEPTAGLTWVRTSLDDMKVFGQTLAFDDADGLTGRLGARVSGKHAFTGGPTVVFYAGAAAVRNFSDDQGLTFTSGGTSQAVAFKTDRTWGESVLGLSARLGHGVTTYVEGDGDFGGGRDAAGLRLGARFNF